MLSATIDRPGMAAISAKRAADLAKHGGANEKEAQGLRLILQTLREDGRLEFHKSFEGARADFCVYNHDQTRAPALGIQLKTTGGNVMQSGYKYYQFNCTDGYDGLLMVCVALHTQPPRIWIRRRIPGGQQDRTDCSRGPTELDVRPT